MKKIQTLIKGLFFLILLSCKNKVVEVKGMANSDRKSIHQYKVQDIQGNTFDFSSLQGKKVMIVNTASKCGLTPQYEQLETLYKKYKDKNFIIIGFPANDFLEQEPGTNNDIAQFCKLNYGVTFPMMAKVIVTGKEQCQVYQFLTKKALNGVLDSDVAWNFQKYLLNENGQLDKIIPPRTLPNDIEIINWIENK